MTSRFPTPEEFATFPAPNYVNPETKTAQILGVMIPMMVLVVVFMGSRLWSRMVIVWAVGLDDWLMLVATLTSLANNIMVCISTGRGYQNGYHLWDVKPENIYGTMKAAQVGMATQLLFIVTLSLTKLAILVTYLRIFPSKSNRWFCYTMLVYTTAWLFGAFFLVLFQCSPVETYWMIFKYFLKAKCLNVKLMYYIQGSTNTLSDFFIFLWPAKGLHNVKVSFRQRVTLTAMFCFGLIVCVAGCARIYYTYMFLTHYDIFWHAANAYSVMAVESSVGIVCGCLPGCKPLLSRMFPQIFGKNSKANSRTPKFQSSGGSFPLQSLARDVIIKEEGYKVEYTDTQKPLPTTPLPIPTPTHSRRGSFARRLSLPITRSRTVHEYSSENQGLIILQGAYDWNKRDGV